MKNTPAKNTKKPVKVRPVASKPTVKPTKTSNTNKPSQNHYLLKVDIL
jgi:hypothetical protein